MQTRRERRKRQPPGKSSSREFYYVGPPSTFQTRRGLESVHTRGPLRNIQCEELDEKTKLQCERQTSEKLHQLRIKQFTITVDGKSIGKGLFAITTHDPEQVIFQNGQHIIDYVGEIIAEHEREERYGNGTGPYCIGGEAVSYTHLTLPTNREV